MFPLESCVSHHNNCCKTDVFLYINNNAKNAFCISFWLKLWYHLTFFFPVKLVFQLTKGHKSTLAACTPWSCIAHSKLWGGYCTVWSSSWWKWPCTHTSHAETPLVLKEVKQWQDVPPFFWWLQMALVFFAAICIQTQKGKRIGITKIITTWLRSVTVGLDLPFSEPFPQGWWALKSNAQGIKV